MINQNNKIKTSN